MDIGSRIKKIRERQGITQDELAKKAGYAGKSAICKIETSGEKVSFKTVCRLAEPLNTTPAHIYGWMNEDKGIETTEKLCLSIFSKLSDKNKLKTLTYMQELMEGQNDH